MISAEDDLKDDASLVQNENGHGNSLKKDNGDCSSVEKETGVGSSVEEEIGDDGRLMELENGGDGSSLVIENDDGCLMGKEDGDKRSMKKVNGNGSLMDEKIGYYWRLMMESKNDDWSSVVEEKDDERSVTVLGDAISADMKLEDKVIVNKRFWVVMSGGAMMGRGDVAYGGSLEATLRDKDYPLGRSLSTLGLSVMDWHGDLAIGGHLQSQIPIGRSSNMITRANLNNRGSGQISIWLNSSEQLQIVLVGLIPLLRKLFGYSQQMQFGQ